MTSRPAARRVRGAVAGILVVAAACTAGDADPSLRPDTVLRAELGLTDADRVHRIALRGGPTEVAEPDSLEVLEGDWVEFVTLDWRVHEVRFDGDALGPEALAFLEGSDQLASPPLVQLDARFVVSFLTAPEGRYPFVVEGNGTPVRGVVVVAPRR